jgi:hypothetical protein
MNKLAKAIPFTFQALEEKEVNLNKLFTEEELNRLVKALQKDKSNGLMIDFRKQLWNNDGKIKFNYETELY